MSRVGRGLLRASIAAISWLVAAAAFAAGTPAGTPIPNSAILTYAIGGVAARLTAVAPVIRVAEVINLSLIAQGVTASNSPDTGQALAFVLTNTGNGSEAFAFTRNNLITGTGDQFDPVSAASSIYIESGLLPGFQATGPNADTVYTPGVNEPVLAADISRVIYLVSQIPAGQPTGALGYASLTASAVTIGAVGAIPGTSLIGAGRSVADASVVVDAVVGSSRARAVAQGSYLVSGLALAVNKTIVSVKDPQGGALVMPGAVLTYRVVLSLTGVGTADNLVLADPLAANTTYVPASLLVDGTARTDALDGDNASFGAAGISVVFGNTVAPATRTVELKATVN
jgi:uncharacterized repeat protein (TIGR01451 family)